MTFIPRKLDIEIVKETENILAYYHTRPFWSVHIVVTPKKHVDSLLELDDSLGKEMLGVIKDVANSIKNEYGSCRVLTNLGDYQDSKHLHIHVSSGEKLRKD